MQRIIDSSAWTGRQPRPKRFFVNFTVDIAEPRGLWFWGDDFKFVTARITGFW
jgi:hypothetical protein